MTEKDGREAEYLQNRLAKNDRIGYALLSVMMQNRKGRLS